MKKSVTIIISLFLLSLTTVSSAEYIKGYIQKDGTYVKGHFDAETKLSSDYMYYPYEGSYLANLENVIKHYKSSDTYYPDNSQNYDYQNFFSSNHQYIKSILKILDKVLS